jgi:ferrous iron transport protein B
LTSPAVLVERGRDRTLAPSLFDPCTGCGERATRACSRTPAATARQTATIALIGNPNTGKTVLFNALTGFRRKVANYPGVTVDIGEAPIRSSRHALELLDLPGTYSLAAASPDEMVVCNVLSGRVSGRRRPDAILAVVDASNLRRNLYLVSQLLDFGTPVIVALNMVDVARARGLEIDVRQLAERLGVPVIPIVATDRRTLPPFMAALDAALEELPVPAPPRLPKPIEESAARLAARGGGQLTRCESLRILLDHDGWAEREFLAHGGSAAELGAARRLLVQAQVDGPAGEIRARYAWIDDILDRVVTRRQGGQITWSSRLDRILTHKFGGSALLLVVLCLVFQSIFYAARPLMNAIEALFALLSSEMMALLPDGVLRSLLIDGVVGGVGSVLVFLPQIMILFALIAVLEDCGYMARAAFMVDRLMRGMGLSGLSFIPLLSSFACAVPAIMSTRTIADRRERFVTILVIPFMSCSARLPVYLVMIGALVPDINYAGGLIGLPALVMLAMYLVGIVVAIPVAWLLRKTAFAGPTPGFLLELPSYKLPRASAVLHRAYSGGRSFLVRAGSIILVLNLVVWALAYFPHDAAGYKAIEQQARAASWSPEHLRAELDARQLRYSYLGRLGQGIEPALRPLGWDWRIGVSVLASFPAREMVVATLGTLFNLGESSTTGSESLHKALQTATWIGTGRPLFTLPVALSIMIFFALCAQCGSTLVMIGRETRSLAWPIISFLGMTTLAYFAAWGMYAAAHAAGL